MVEVSLTVGKLDASLALLLTQDHHLIEFPTILLPHGVKAGSIVKIKCDRDLETELEERKQFQSIQDEILTTFGKNLPKAPVLGIKNVTQTSCVLEWDPLDLGTASLKSLVLFKDGKKLGAIPQPMTNRTTKLSGLPIDKTFKFQLRLDSTAGVYSSESIEVTTHKMTDLSGINVCLGDITPNDQFTIDDIQEALKNMGAHYPALTVTRVDTTHYITTRENKQNPEFVKANDMNIPIIRPEWLKACERERRIVGVREFYVKECALPDIIARNYWKNPAAPPPPPAKDNVAAPSRTSDAREPSVNAAAEPSANDAGEPSVNGTQDESSEQVSPTALNIVSVEISPPSPEGEEAPETEDAKLDSTPETRPQEAVEAHDIVPEIHAEESAVPEETHSTKEVEVPDAKETLTTEPEQSLDLGDESKTELEEIDLTDESIGDVPEAESVEAITEADFVPEEEEEDKVSTGLSKQEVEKQLKETVAKIREDAREESNLKVKSLEREAGREAEDGVEEGVEDGVDEGSVEHGQDGAEDSTEAIVAPGSSPSKKNKKKKKNKK